MRYSCWKNMITELAMASLLELDNGTSIEIEVARNEIHDAWTAIGRTYLPNGSARKILINTDATEWSSTDLLRGLLAIQETVLNDICCCLRDSNKASEQVYKDLKVQLVLSRLECFVRYTPEAKINPELSLNAVILSAEIDDVLVDHAAAMQYLKDSGAI